MATNYAFLPAFIDLFYQKIVKPEVEKKNNQRSEDRLDTNHFYLLFLRHDKNGHH